MMTVSSVGLLSIRPASSSTSRPACASGLLANRIVVVVESPSTPIVATAITRTTHQIPMVRQGRLALDRARSVIEGMFISGVPFRDVLRGGKSNRCLLYTSDAADD